MPLLNAEVRLEDVLVTPVGVTDSGGGLVAVGHGHGQVHQGALGAEESTPDQPTTRQE